MSIIVGAAISWLELFDLDARIPCKVVAEGWNRRLAISNLRPPKRPAVWKGGCEMKFLLWCILLILCWPLALFALVLYPIVWLLLLPFRIVGIAVHGVLELVAALIFLPARLLRAI